MKKPFKALSCAAALSLLAAFSLPAAAQSAGTNIFGVGWFHLAPNDSSEPLSFSQPTAFAGPISGSGASIDSADTVGLAITHFWTDNLATTLDVGIPPTFHLQAEGTFLASRGVTEIGSAKQWSPALVAKWFFGDAESKFRPFVGAGVTYVWYTGVQLSQPLQNAATITGQTGTSSAHLSSSWAPVANVGASYNFDKNWSMSLSVSYIPLKTNADITTTGSSLGTTVAHTTLTINPLITFLSMGYAF